MRTLFKNGEIYDGTGGKPYIGDAPLRPPTGIQPSDLHRSEKLEAARQDARHVPPGAAERAGHVYINGQAVLENGTYIGGRAGKVLLKK